jgi:hypothetical protein
MNQPNWGFSGFAGCCAWKVPTISVAAGIGLQLIPALPQRSGRVECEISGCFRIQGKG